jgi:DNA primase
VALHDVAARFYRDQLADSWVPGYLTARGFDAVAQARWQAGYAPARRDALVRYLRSANYPDTLILAAGLARRSGSGRLTDTFRDRAVLPIRSSRGPIIAFIGRAPPQAGPDVPKYLNSPSTLLYDKSQSLFGLWQARESVAAGAVPVITEGPFDAIAIAIACPSRYAPVALCGAMPTAGQVATLRRACDLRATGLLVALDADRAGHRAAARAYRLLSPLTSQLATVDLRLGHDPAQILSDHGPAILAAVLKHRSHPLADLVTDTELEHWKQGLCFAEGQVAALRAIAPVIAALPPAHVGRQVGRLAARLSLDHPTVTEAVTDALSLRSAG